MPPGRLLVLDDDPAVGQTLAFVAEDMGLEVVLTTNAEEFFGTLDWWNPSHITVDLLMPDMDGVEVIRKLAARGCQARVIISSGVGSRILEAARRSAAEHGLIIAGALAKPFLPSSLRELLAMEGQSAIVGGASTAASPDGLEVTEARLRQALDEREFHLVYQPKIDCKTGALAGFEALVRWHHREAGIVMPDCFIQQAEQWELINGLTRRVSDLALRWLAQVFPDSNVTISVNLSARAVVDFELGDMASDLCRDLGIEPSRLIFELTESSAMKDPVAALAVLTRLRMKRFQLAIDDFGTGYSSMVQLVRLPFSEIKVDRSFVKAAAHSQEARTVIHSIVDLGHSLGLQVTAEGVEDAQALAYLNEVGCDQAQGSFIGSPLPGNEVADWLASRASV